MLAPRGGNGDAVASGCTQNGSVRVTEALDVDGNATQSIVFDKPFPLAPTIAGLTIRQPFTSSTEVDDINGVTVSSVTKNGFAFIVNTNLVSLTEPLFVDWEASYGESTEGCPTIGEVSTNIQFSLELLNDISANMTVKTADAGGVEIDWGDGTIEIVANNVLASHVYTSIYTGLVKISSVTGSDITSFTSTDGFFSADNLALPRTITTLAFYTTNAIYGLVEDFPPGVTSVTVGGSQVLIGGDIGQLPDNFANVVFNVNGAYTGDIALIPSTSLNGNMNLGSKNTTYGLIQELPLDVGKVFCAIGGDSTVGGDLGLMNPAYETVAFRALGALTSIVGDVGAMPVKLGTNEIRIGGGSSLSGLIDDFPATVGASIINITDVNSTIAGDLANTSIVTNIFQLTGANTITGDIGLIPATAGTSTFNVQGNNSLYGDIATITPGIGSATFAVVSNFTNITGDLANKPATSGASTFTMEGAMHLTYSGGITLAQIPTLHFEYEPTVGFGTGLSAAEVDQLIIDIEATGWAGARLRLAGANAAPTAASAAAIVSLTGRGVTVSTS